MIKTIFLILITIFFPPLGVFFVAGCSTDLIINILLTLLGYIPGHVHAFYLEYVYIKRRDERRSGIVDTKPAPGVYSSKVQNGGTKVKERDVIGGPVATPAAQQGYIGQRQQGYGTLQ